MKSWQRWGLTGVVAGALLASGSIAVAAWPQGPGPIPDEASAAAVLADAYAARDNIDAMCQVASAKGNCLVMADSAGPAPKASPRIACSFAYEGDNKHAAGLAMRMVVAADNGTTITTDTIALESGGTVTLMNPVYWSGARVSSGSASNDVWDFPCG